MPWVWATAAVKYVPRPYQSRVIQEAREKLRDIRKRVTDRGPRLMIQLSTGGGKTAIAGFIAQGHLKSHPAPRVAFLCHRDFLVAQTSGTFAAMGIDHSFVAQGRWLNKFSNVHICMVQTLRARMAKIYEPTLVIWDESHHIGAKTWEAIMHAWPNAMHIGLSATPVRLDGKGLDAHFDDMVIGPSTAELIELGALSDYVYYTPSAPDLTGVKTRAGDFANNQLEAVMDRAVIVGDMVRHYQRLARGKRAIYYCTSIKHSEHTAEAFKAAGIMAVHLDGKASTWERQQAAKAFAMGDIQVLTNVDLFSEGYDLAAQAGMDVTIDAVGLARPTQSLGLYLQQVGRALRPAPGKKAIFLDHAGNCERGHGLPDDDREWSLEGVGKSKAGTGSATRECEQCFARVPISAKSCRYCGHVMGSSSSGAGVREIEQVDGELEEIDKDAIRKQRKKEEWSARTLGDLIEVGRRRGYKFPEGWAAKIWTLRERGRRKKEHSEQQALEFYEQARR